MSAEQVPSVSLSPSLTVTSQWQYVTRTNIKIKEPPSPLMMSNYKRKVYVVYVYVSLVLVLLWYTWFPETMRYLEVWHRRHRWANQVDTHPAWRPAPEQRPWQKHAQMRSQCHNVGQMMSLPNWPLNIYILFVHRYDDFSVSRVSPRPSPKFHFDGLSLWGLLDLGLGLGLENMIYQWFIIISHFKLFPLELDCKTASDWI